MECNWLINNLGFDCRPVPGVTGASVLEVDTPFSFCDGEPVCLYVSEHGDNVLVSDNGDTIAHLMGAGLNMSNKRAWSAIRSRIEPYDMTLMDTGEIRSLGSRRYASDVIAQYITGMLAVVDYERHSLASSTDINILVDEVEMLLRAWKPTEAVVRRPQVSGISRRSHVFDLQVGRTLVDAVAPNAAAVGGVMRKAGDVLSSTNLGALEIMVVIDDRRDHAAALMERDIVSALVKTILYSDLEQASHRTRSSH